MTTAFFRILFFLFRLGEKATSFARCGKRLGLCLYRELFVLAVVLLVAMSAVAAADIDSEAYWQPKWEEMASLGRGYVVWESNRSGRWRLYYRELDGTGKRQLTPDEQDRDHYGTHISPDGTRVVYISYPRTRNAYNPLRSGETAQLRIVNIDGSNDRELVSNARAYFENRAAVWINNHELIYIDGEGYTCRLDLETGGRERLTVSAHREYGWLIDPMLAWATDGRPRFSPYDPQTKTITEQRKHRGCQPYFTQDGVWGFWTEGAGGPIKRIHLASGATSNILNKDDVRMPGERNYLYFPMVSPCQRLFTVGASPNQHDHHNSDYAVFAFRMDPDTLELTGQPVRYTFDGNTDRYPNAFLAYAELGTHRGKAPLTLTFQPEAEDRWRWEFGDGFDHKGRQATHTYTEPGTYTVTARRGDEILMGSVVVLEAVPPRVRMPVIAHKRQVLVNFNEPVSIDAMNISMASGNTIESLQLSEDQEQLTITMSNSVGKDTLRLSGVTDLAQRPNAMQPQELAIKPSVWPSDTAGLLFVWETGDRANMVSNPETGEQRAFPVNGRGKAALNHHRAMITRGGAFVADDSFNSYLLDEITAANQLTIEATVTPDHSNQRGPARIVTFSTNASSRNFTLGQDGRNLVMRLRTPQTGRNGLNPQVTLGRLKINEPNHVIVSYKPGRMVCYFNGEKVFDGRDVQGGFENWERHHFLMGDEYQGDRTWEGTLEGVAIYSRFMDKEEAHANARHYLGFVSARKSVPQVQVEAKLLATSQFPTLAQIEPYREALVIYEYQVVNSVENKLVGNDDRIRVAHWALLNGGQMPARQHEVGQRYQLMLEPFAANTQIEGMYQSDTLPDDFDVELFYHPLTR